MCGKRIQATGQVFSAQWFDIIIKTDNAFPGHAGEIMIDFFGMVFPYHLGMQVTIGKDQYAC